VGATFNFGAEKMTSRVGISFISSAQACQSVQEEIPATTTLSALVNETKAIWNEKVLSKVTTTETNIANLQLLYSSLYHMSLTPSNRTGENPLWKSNVPYYDDIFTLWDLYRTWMPLVHILQPTTYKELLQSSIDVWRHEGYLPAARSANYNGPVEGGTFADQILADAYIKGVQGINWTDAYAAMVTNAEVTPPNNHDPRAPDSSTKDGRGALPDWKEKRFITSRFSRAASRAIDYSGNDWGLHQVATGLGHVDDAEKYLDRSRNWRNHWNPEAESLGFRGFVMPRDGHGFVEHDPAGCCGYWEDPYYEGSAWEYSFGALHDVPHLIELCGGSETFVERLGMIFKERLMHGRKRMIYGR
jgi:putative alpha-1,2-mannosidase